MNCIRLKIREWTKEQLDKSFSKVYLNACLFNNSHSIQKVLILTPKEDIKVKAMSPVLYEHKCFLEIHGICRTSSRIDKDLDCLAEKLIAAIETGKAPEEVTEFSLNSIESAVDDSSDGIYGAVMLSYSVKYEKKEESKGKLIEFSGGYLA